jgi:glycosyltransferase involved in cell wall biosynthesis
MRTTAEEQSAASKIGAGEDIELSVVTPGLHERATVGAGVQKALGAMGRHGIRGEVIVADHGSTDGSQQIAGEHGARVAPIKTRVKRGRGVIVRFVVFAGTFCSVGV